ncbi:DUF4957 domain-containing protein [Gaoshiqia sp. Z1-71]|uniref:DUF4957 domain-containing protein n=1 Tax=Gaoshiqia hydrogeniformans TaxID=3290090 RepID=UPI003BF8E767
MKNRFKNILLILGLFSLAFVSCEDKIDPLIEELQFERVFTPLDLTVRIRNMTTAELTWSLRDDADYYVVEISENAFASTVVTRNVDPGEVPVSIQLDGETAYSARVKGVSESGMNDSKWAEVNFMTNPENIFLPVQDGDVDALYAILRWPAGSDVTHLLINGQTQRILTADEKEAGVALIEGLTGETTYTVNLFRDTKERGTVIFTTLIDVGNATRVYPEDDLSAVVADAAPGDVLVLYPGEYLVYTGALTLNKSISIRGLYPYDKPVVHIQFSIEAGAQDVTISDLELDGDGTLIDVFRFNTAGLEYGSLVISGCNIHDYDRSFVAGNVASKVTSVSIDNSLITNILTNGGDFIDFRTTYLANLSITNSTFNKCAPARDFIRMDAAAAYSGTGLTSTVLIDRCTIIGACNTEASTRRLLYVRFLNNSLTVRNTLIAATIGFYSNQANTSQPAFLNNNYYEAPWFYQYLEGQSTTNFKYDTSNYTTLNPGFTNAPGGDFTVTNQTLLDNAVGDPRWRP